VDRRNGDFDVLAALHPRPAVGVYLADNEFALHKNQYKDKRQ
jgi:hypothetical protein